ncbi:MAG: flagellin [Myxococcota bacterium]|nr:flagellin [Myxococcota bacterium]
MGLSINTNVVSRAIRKRSGLATTRIAKSQERLSTGLRINSAADDSANLAISERMNKRIRGNNIARRNISDGISMVQTAESGLGEINAILQKLRESAVAAANETYTSSDRSTLDNDAKQLLQAMNQIASSTSFNKKRLLDGTTQGLNIQAGASSRTNESVSLSFSNMSASAVGQLATETFAMINEPDPILAGEMVINGVGILGTQAFADEVGHNAISNEQLSSAYAKGQAIINSNIDARVEIIPPTVTHTFVPLPVSPLGYNLSINGVTISVATDPPPATVDELVNNLNAFTDSTGVTATVVDSGAYTLTAEDGRNINIRAGGATSYAHGWVPAPVLHQGSLKFTSDKAINIVGKAFLLGAPASTDNYSILPDTNSIQNRVDLTSRDGARESIDRIDVAIDQVLAQRAKLGSAANKLESLASSLSTTNENLTAAKSRIKDADISSESANLTRSQILQQASLAMLSQVNQAPRNLLSLLS